MNKSIEKILVDIITHELDLPETYGKNERGDVIPCVVIYSQNIKLFNTDKIQITVKTVNSRTFSSRCEFKENPKPLKPDGSDAFIQIQNINQSRLMQIDIYSRNNEARERYWEVTAALNSVYAQEQMDKYNFKLGILANEVNISGIDGGSDINRFTISFNALIHFTKERFINYYDKFKITANNEQGQFFEMDNY